MGFKFEIDEKNDIFLFFCVIPLDDLDGDCGLVFSVMLAILVNSLN